MQYGWQVVGLLPNIVLCFIYINKLHKLSHSWHCIVELYKFIQCKYVNACAKQLIRFCHTWLSNKQHINSSEVGFVNLIHEGLRCWMKDWMNINKSASTKLNKGYINLVMFLKFNVWLSCSTSEEINSTMRSTNLILFLIQYEHNPMFYKYSKILR